MKAHPDFETSHNTFSANGPLKSYCYKRLTYLSSKFQVVFNNP